MKDSIDMALLGDSITQGWGGGWDGAPFNAAGQKHFASFKTANRRIEGVLWREVFADKLKPLIERLLAKQ
jgi:hypothetical protein